MTSARGLDDEQDTGRVDRHADAGVARGAADAGIDDVMFDLGGDERRMHVRAYNHWVSLLRGRPYPTIADLDPGSIADFGPHSVLMDFRLPDGTQDADGPLVTDDAGTIAPQILDPRIAFLGTALREECGLVGPIESIADVPSRSLLSRLTDHYLQIIANRAPIGFEAEYVNSRGRTTLYRGILMPFASNDDGIDFLYGVINWKELADAGLQATLTAELDAAVRAMPPRGGSGLAAYAMAAPTMPGLARSGLARSGLARSGLAGPELAGTSGVGPAGHAQATSPNVPVWADGPSAQFEPTPRPEMPELPEQKDDTPADLQQFPGVKPVLAHVTWDGDRSDAETRAGDAVLLVARVASGGGYDIIGAITDDRVIIDGALQAIR